MKEKCNKDLESLTWEQRDSVDCLIYEAQRLGFYAGFKAALIMFNELKR